jgi:energy-converting hydrogenase Eha subunit F
MPPVKSMSKAGRLIIREAVRYDEYTSVGMPSVKKVGGQFDEVIPIARHKDTVFRCSILQLGFIIETVSLYLMDTEDIEAQTAPNRRHSGVDILVQ